MADGGWRMADGNEKDKKIIKNNNNKKIKKLKLKKLKRNIKK